MPLGINIIAGVTDTQTIAQIVDTFILLWLPNIILTKQISNTGQKDDSNWNKPNLKIQLYLSK